MSHLYDNFDDAYADLVVQWDNIIGWWNTSKSQVVAASDDWVAGDALKAIGHLISVCAYQNNLFGHYPGFNYGTPDQAYVIESIYWANKDVPDPPEFELTWKAICEAWVANDFEGKEWTIACIDRMRTLMWDEPFSIQWAASPDAPR